MYSIVFRYKSLFVRKFFFVATRNYNTGHYQFIISDMENTNDIIEDFCDYSISGFRLFCSLLSREMKTREPRWLSALLFISIFSSSLITAGLTQNGLSNIQWNSCHRFWDEGVHLYWVLNNEFQIPRGFYLHFFRYHCVW